VRRNYARPFSEAIKLIMAALSTITAYLDDLLKVGAITDWPTASNGLQVENSGAVHKIGAAVDASEFTLRAAAAGGVSLLLVHHGLFWAGLQPATGPSFRKLKLAFNHDVAVYSAHLPLDVHPKLGNNVLLCRELGFRDLAPFLLEKGQFIGWQTEAAMARDELVQKLEAVLSGPVKLCPGGPEQVRRIGVVTGGAGSEVAKAAAEGVDTFITGEGPHHTFALAEELGVNLLYGGHYATETFGVKALAAQLGRRFKLPWAFIDHPTGL
jgi:dinuclear metal center YbgI/SA1388 family protein